MASPLPLPQDPSDRSPAEKLVSPSETTPLQGSEINVNGAWNVSANDSVEAGLVMGGTSWPSLSHSTKASPKSSSSNGLLSVSPGPVVTSPRPKPSMTSSNGNPTSICSPPTRQKSMEHAAGGGSVSDSGEIIPNKLTIQEHSPKTLHNNNKNNNHNIINHSEQVSRGGAYLSQPHGVNEHHRSYGQRGNNGGGGYHYGNRRDQDHGSNQWNHRSFGNRDANLQQRAPLLFFRPLVPVPAPLIAPIPPPVRPFGSSMGYPDFPAPVYYVATHPPPEPLRGVPFPPGPPHPTMFFPPVDPLHAKLLKQVEYYFSYENLCKDLYLRQNMDHQGWVPISLIAGFNKVTDITHVNDITINTQHILNTMPMSSLVEVQVQEEKLRNRYEWMRWMLPTNNSGQQIPTSTGYNSLPAHMQALELDATDQNNTRARSEMSRSGSGYLVGGLNGKGSDDLGNARSLSRSDTM